MCAAGFPEPYTFSLRARELLRAPARRLRPRPRQPVPRAGASSHMIDATAGRCSRRCTTRSPSTATSTWPTRPAAYRKLTLRRWYGFLDMQMKVARQIPRLVTVSESSKRDITAQMGVPADRLHIVPVGVDPEIFRPRPHIARVPGRLMTTASADVPMKGLAPLLEARRQGPHRARGRAPRRRRQAEGQEHDPRADRAPRAGRRRAVRQRRHHRAHRRALRRGRGRVRAVAVRGLLAARRSRRWPAACPLVATTGGAVPEVVGRDNETGLLGAPRRPVGAGHRDPRAPSATPSCAPASARPGASARSAGSPGARPRSAPSSSTARCSRSTARRAAC